MARVLVTGATGFVGSYLIEALVDRGDEVVCLTRSTSNVERLAGQPVKQAQGHLGDSESLQAAVANVDVVYHVAGVIKALSQDDFMEVNAEGTRNLAAACAAQLSPPILLFVSSLAAAGPAIEVTPLRESDPCLPVSDYGRSKRAGELAAASFADRLPVTIVRPPIVFGPRDPSTWKMFNPIGRFGVHFVPGYRHGRRYSLVHSADLVEAMIQAAGSGKRIDVADARGDSFRQGCYFVAFDQHPTFAEFGNLIGQAYGRGRVAKIPIPDTMMTLLGEFSEMIGRVRKTPHILGRDKAREVRAGSWICSADMIKEDLGFSPATTLDERLRETVAELSKKAL